MFVITIVTIIIPFLGIQVVLLTVVKIKIKIIDHQKGFEYSKMDNELLKEIKCDEYCYVKINYSDSFKVIVNEADVYAANLENI